MFRRTTNTAAAVALWVCTVLVGTAQAQRAARSPEELAKAGSEAIEAGRYREAFDAFSEAAQQRPRDTSLYVGAAYAAFMFGQLADAQRWLERALEINPQYTTASVLLGRVLYRQGSVKEAVDALETAQKYAPDNRDVSRLLDEWRKDSQLQSAFYESRGAHFSVLFEGPADDAIARKIVEILEQAYYRIGSSLMTYPSRTITVMLYTQQQFRDMTRSPSWAVGIYDGRIKLPVGGALQHSDELQRVVEHELVHAMIANIAGPSIPTWLNEGLAVTLETGDAGWIDRVLASYRRRIPLGELSRGFLGLDSDAALLAYAEGADAVKQMIALRGMPAVVSLLQSLGRGGTFDSAFQQAIFMRFEDFDTHVSR